VAPWARLGFPTPPTENDTRTLNRLRAVFLTLEGRALGDSDLVLGGRGHIYIFWCTGDDGYYKIGKTARGSPRKRLAEWRRRIGGGDMQFLSWPVSYGVDVAERLVHLYLHYCRVRRYPAIEPRGLYKSFWWRDRTPITDDGQWERVYAIDTRRSAAQCEWFRTDRVRVEEIVRNITMRFEKNGGVLVV